MCRRDYGPLASFSYPTGVPESQAERPLQLSGCASVRGQPRIPVKTRIPIGSNTPGIICSGGQLSNPVSDHDRLNRFVLEVVLYLRPDVRHR